MWVNKPIELKRATAEDAYPLQHFLNYEIHIHRHLDWREPIDWLGQQPFWLLVRGERILAALACPTDPPNIAWVRLFSCSETINRFEAWNLLFEKARIDLLSEGTDITIAAVSLRDWFTRILVKSEFSHHEDIVLLEWEPTGELSLNIPDNLHLRDMQASDLREVANIDRMAFSPFWHIPYNGLSQAFNQSSHAIIAEIHQQTIGFQISTSNPFGAHLARLAVRPDMQKKSIGRTLVNEMLIHYINYGLDRITVNTQKDNTASIALYKSMNFKLSNESFPVFIYQNKM